MFIPKDTCPGELPKRLPEREVSEPGKPLAGVAPHKPGRTTLSTVKLLIIGPKASLVESTKLVPLLVAVSTLIGPVLAPAGTSVIICHGNQALPPQGAKGASTLFIKTLPGVLPK